MRSTGTIRSWDFEEGQGIIDSSDIPGGVVVSGWSIRCEAITVDSPDGMGMHGLEAGEPVDFYWRRDDDGDGYEVTDVWPCRCDGPDSPSTGAFRSALWMSATREDGVAIMREVDPNDLPPVPPRPPLRRSTGVVVVWRPEEGWGVVEAPETPGGAWTHFSEIRGDGYRSLVRDQRVEFDWEPAHQDGYSFRASDVAVVDQA
ncbi:cold-shock protein [Williamsia serinedens]|uniref:Cold shock protein, CspA family n=1 Tax=Williamsia serinedens TaxID=391736 RepID=A0ABT1H4S6_9NOCA|nr:cold shock domain-containing protein [Williamsia serinedens]MCP2162242.1 Cold shock protein, CspA family [Williamsia serinedens]